MIIVNATNLKEVGELDIEEPLSNLKYHENIKELGEFKLKWSVFVGITWLRLIGVLLKSLLNIKIIIVFLLLKYDGKEVVIQFYNVIINHYPQSLIDE